MCVLSCAGVRMCEADLRYKKGEIKNKKIRHARKKVIETVIPAWRILRGDKIPLIGVGAGVFVGVDGVAGALSGSGEPLVANSGDVS